MPINYNEYPQNWKSEIRPRILARAGQVIDTEGRTVKQAKCEQCGVTNYAVIKRTDNSYKIIDDFEDFKQDNYPGYSDQEVMKRMGFTKVVLTIAHLNHDKLNHDVKDEELKALCQKCHLAHDMSKHVRNRKYGRNSEALQNKLGI
jgi:hypothetical protein